MEGGHEVPISKIIGRYARSLANCRAAVRLADRAYLYDNSMENAAARLLLRTIDGRVFRQYGEVNQWAREIFSGMDALSDGN